MSGKVDLLLTANCMPGNTQYAPAPGTAAAPPPINFFYSHFHNAIKIELDSLSTSVLLLEQAIGNELVSLLQHLKERYHFLEQVYKYHSSVEDEVVYPALDAKVKNVTLAYSVEHQDEEALFEQLSKLLVEALQQTGTQRSQTVRKLVCKVEEIHTTLRKHLAKEEAQLLPLLLQVRLHAVCLRCAVHRTVRFIFCPIRSGFRCMLLHMQR